MLLAQPSGPFVCHLASLLLHVWLSYLSLAGGIPMPIRIGVIWVLTNIFLLTHPCKPLLFCLYRCLLATLASDMLPVGFEWGRFLPGVVNPSTNFMSCSNHSCDNHHSICLFFGFWRRGFGRPWGIPRTNVLRQPQLARRGALVFPVLCCHVCLL